MYKHLQKYMQQSFIHSAYSRLSGLGVARLVFGDKQRELAARNAEKTAQLRKKYTERAKQVRQKKLAEQLRQQQAERARKGAERMKAEREFRAARLADRALHYQVPNTRLGRWLLENLHPLATCAGLLVWRELWCGSHYSEVYYAVHKLNRRNAWA